MAHGNDLACQQTCHVIQMVTTPVIITVPIISGEQQPPLIFSLKKQGPHRKWWRGNQQWTNNNNTWCIWTTDKVEVNTITPPAPLLFHTRNRNHVTIGNGQQKWTNNHDDKWMWQWLQMKDNDLACLLTCHVIQTVMTTSIVTVHIDPGEWFLSPYFC